MKLKTLYTFMVILFFTNAINLSAQTLTWIGGNGAFDVSDDGTVVAGIFTTVPGTGIVHAFRWTAGGGIQDLGTLPGTERSIVTAMNSDGSVIVGWCYNQVGGSKAYRWTLGGGMQELIPGVYSSRVVDISADGTVIVGNFTATASSIGVPFRWSLSGGVEDLSPYTGTNAVLTGVSDDGSVITGNRYNSGGPDAFKLTGTSLELPSIPGYEDIYARGISGDGLVSFGHMFSSTFTYYAFRWDTVVNNLGVVGQNGIVYRSVYDGSKMVGEYSPTTNNRRAFVWTNANGIEDLNTKYASLLTGTGKFVAATSISNNGRFIVGHGINPATSRASAFLLDTQWDLSIIKPNFQTKFIAGEKDTIKWEGGQSGQTLQIEYSTDNGANWFLVGYSQAEIGQYIWDVPQDLLTTKAKIKIKDALFTPHFVESYKFKIKPYVLTRIDQNGDYYEFKKNRDQWGFSNTQNDMWPQTWWQQFNYQGIDPFTGC